MKKLIFQQTYYHLMFCRLGQWQNDFNENLSNMCRPLNKKQFINDIKILLSDNIKDFICYFLITY